VRNRFPYNASPIAFGRGRTGNGVATDILLRLGGLR
jgi:hypothetical protein